MDENEVSGESSGNVVGTNNDARLRMLQEINDRNDRESAADFSDINDDGSLTAFDVEPAEDEAAKIDEPSDEVKEPEVTEPEPEVEEPPIQKFKIKVNGKEIELTAEELIARAQKVESADQYLADAARARRETEAEVRPQIPAGPTEAELLQQRDEEDARIVRAIQMGTEEEAKAAVKLLTSRIAPRPSVSPDDMSRAIDERLAFNEAISEFRREFPDIHGDPLLTALANQRDIDLINKGDNRPYIERYKTIGMELRAWKESLAPAPKAEKEVKEADTSLEDKKAKKAAAPKVPSIAAKKVAQVKEDDDDGEEDTSAVIANMAKARGGPQWMRG